MATTRAAKPTEELIKQAQELFGSNPDDGEPEDVALLDVLADLGANAADALVNVYRIEPNTKKLKYLYRCMPVEFNMETLRDDYDGGDFRIHVKRDGLLLANKAISVETPRKKPEPLAPVIAPQQNNDLAVMMMQVMQTGFEKLGTLIVEASRGNQVPPVNPADLEDRFMNRMVMMRQLFDPGTKNDSAQLMEMFTKGITIAKELGGGGGESSEMDVLNNAIRTLGPALAGAASLPSMASPVSLPPPQQSFTNPNMLSRQSVPVAAQTPQIPSRPAAPSVTAPGQPQQTPSSAQAPGDQMQQMMKYVAILAEKAKANKDPALYADLIIDELGPDQVKELLADPALLDKAAMMFPDIALYKEWFENLRDCLTQFVSEGDSISQSPQLLYTPPIGLQQIPAGATNATSGDNGDFTAHS